MRVTTLSAMALAMALATPAFAQQSPGEMPTTGQMPEGTAGGSGASAGAATTGRPNAMTQDKLRQTLQQAGFQNIQILDAAYLVQARTQDGDMVLMTINPPTMAGTAGGSGLTPDAGAGESGAAGGGAGQQ